MQVPSRASVALTLALTTGAAWSQEPSVTGFSKVSHTEGAFTGGLEDFDRFGGALVDLGDLDGDGVRDLAVGARNDDDGGDDTGAVWILFLAPDGSVASHQKISDLEGGLPVDLPENGLFGTSLANLGDLDGDDVPELAVGAVFDTNVVTGAVHVLFLHPDGTVKDYRKIDHPHLGRPGADLFLTLFAASLAAVGDVDGDGVGDLAAGEPNADKGGFGAVWTLFLNADGTLKGGKKIGKAQGQFAGTLASQDSFGGALEALGDLNGDGVPDLAVGAAADADQGAVWILYLGPDGTVEAQAKIADDAGLFLEPTDLFGSSLANLGDLDGDGLLNLAVGAPGSDLGGPATTNHGRVWLLELRDNGSVEDFVEIGTGHSAGLSEEIELQDRFGSALAYAGVQSDGTWRLHVGAPGDDDGSSNPLNPAIDVGAVWTLALNGVAPAGAQPYGCGVNPQGSLGVQGLPALGASVAIEIDNPLGTQPAGSLPVAVVASAPDPAFPCGTAVPGLGMGFPGAPGELLVDLRALITSASGAPWPGPGTPARVPIEVPAQEALLGLRVYVQGLLFDAGGTSGITVGLTDAVELTIGV